MLSEAETSHTARQFPRIRMTLPAALTIDARAWTGLTTNISLRGCQAHFPTADAVLVAESAASLALTFPSGTMSVVAVRVVNAALQPEGLTVALEFRRPDPVLAAFLRLHLTAHARRESGEHRAISDQAGYQESPRTSRALR